MRHAGRMKAGFYPTPPNVTELLKRVLMPPLSETHYYGSRRYDAPKRVALLDPTCGDGAPLASIAEGLRQRRPVTVETYGVELDRQRAAKARKRLGSVAVGDARHFKASGFSLLLLNPPYDDAGKGRRLEVEFLKLYIPALRPRGVLVYIIPEKSLAAAAGWLRSHFEDVRAYRFPEDEYRAFGQVVVLGTKRYAPVPAENPVLVVEEDDLEGYALGSYPDPYLLPEVTEDPQLEDHGLEPSAYLEASRESAAWDALLAHSQHSDAPTALPPLVPMAQEHLALLVAAGHLNQTVVPTDEGPLLLRGQVKKVKVELPPEEDEDRVVQRAQERYVSTIQALNLETLELLEVQ